MYSHFIISSKPNFERNALSEAFNFLMEITNKNQPNIFAQTLDVKGLGLLEFKDTTIELPLTLNKINIEMVNEIVYCEKIVPLNGFLKNKNAINDLIGALNPFLGIITSNDKWKIEIKKRHSKAKDKEIIQIIAPEVKKGQVDLKNPDWIIHIDIVKNWIGFGIFKPSQIYSFAKMQSLTLNEKPL